MYGFCHVVTGKGLNKKFARLCLIYLWFTHILTLKLAKQSQGSANSDYKEK